MPSSLLPSWQEIQKYPLPYHQTPEQLLSSGCETYIHLPHSTNIDSFLFVLSCFFVCFVCLSIKGLQLFYVYTTLCKMTIKWTLEPLGPLTLTHSELKMSTSWWHYRKSQEITSVEDSASVDLECLYQILCQSIWKMLRYFTLPPGSASEESGDQQCHPQWTMNVFTNFDGIPLKI